MHYYDFPMNGYGWGGFIMSLLWFVVLILIAALLYRTFQGRGPEPPHSDPLDIAKQRYAKGEITKEQYEQLKKDLAA